MSDPIIPNDSGHTTSTWMDVAVPSFDDAPVPEHTDVCVVGAGMAGLSVAYALAEQGVPVTVLDDGPIAGGESSRTTAHLSCALDDRFHTLEQRFGAAGARLAAESHAAAIDSIERNTRELGIDCGFQRVDGYLFAPDASGSHRLDRELAAAQRAGLPVTRVAHAPLPFDTGPCLRFPQQAEFHPVAYMRGLAQAIIERGGSIHTGVHVAGIEAGEPLTVQLTRGSALRARIVIDATNATITSMVKLPIRQSAYRTYVVALDVPAGAVPHALFWDDADPYHYIRVATGPAGRELLIVGGEDHRTGQEDDSGRRWAVLEEWTRQRFPMAGGIAARWSGQIMEPADGLAYIGKSPDLDHVYIVTGDSGNGLTHGAIAGLLLPDLLRGREHPWARIYAPGRSALRGLATLVREAASSTVQYGDWVKPGDVESIDDIAPGHGALVRRGVHLIAAYRDEAGTCHLRSAKCPHLGGVVHWNTAERTWDCPCHGSRFDEYGRVINGPAIGDLEPAEGLEDLDEQSQKTPHRAA